MYLAWKLKQLAWPTHQRLDGHMVPSVRYLVGFRIGPNSVNEPVRGTFCQDNGNGSIFNFGPRRKCEPQTCSPILSCLGMWWNSWDETGKADQQLHSTEAALCLPWQQWTQQQIHELSSKAATKGCRVILVTEWSHTEKDNRGTERETEKNSWHKKLLVVYGSTENASHHFSLSLTVTYGGHESSGVAARASTHWAISSGWQLPLSSGKTPKAAKVQTPRFLLSAHTLSTTTKVMG